jgi:hypothetical protein
MKSTDFIVARHDLVVDGRGPLAVKQVCLDTLSGRIPPEQGHMLSLVG